MWIQKSQKKEKPVLLPPCETKCRKKCFEKLSIDQRTQIFEYFENLTMGKDNYFLTSL